MEIKLRIVSSSWVGQLLGHCHAAPVDHSSVLLICLVAHPSDAIGSWRVIRLQAKFMGTHHNFPCSAKYDVCQNADHRLTL